MITCFVVDDEFHAVETLTDLIESIPGLKLSGTATNPLEALRFITSMQPPDITFLDINMPEISGVELAGMLSPVTTVILTTAYSDYGLDAFNRGVFDYLLKPITRERFIQCLSKYNKYRPQTKPDAEKSFFFIKSETKGKLIKIKTMDILYIEGALNYIIINTVEGKHITYLTMSEVRYHLPEYLFYRIHKSFIVNVDRIKMVNGATLYLEDKTVLSIGVSYRNDFNDFIQTKLLKSKRN